MLTQHNVSQNCHSHSRRGNVCHDVIIHITSLSPLRLLASLQWVYFSHLSMFSPANTKIQSRIKVYCTLKYLYLGLTVDQDNTLNILTLPNVFQRKVMRTLDFQDRLNLRLTCRSVFAHLIFFSIPRCF